jgi:hypothetical protein
MDEKQKQEQNLKTIALAKDIDVTRALIVGMDEKHLEDTYQTLKEQERQQMEVKDTVQNQLLNKQCYILLKLIEIKKAFKDAEEIKGRLKFKAGNQMRIVNKNDIN